MNAGAGMKSGVRPFLSEQGRHSHKDLKARICPFSSRFQTLWIGGVWLPEARCDCIRGNGLEVRYSGVACFQTRPDFFSIRTDDLDFDNVGTSPVRDVAPAVPRSLNGIDGIGNYVISGNELIGGEGVAFFIAECADIEIRPVLVP